MDDIAVAGGGPAGALAALLLARAGARVRLFERATFPRDKLCGDTLNPGALAILARHVDLAPLRARSVPVAGMRLTGPGSVTIQGRYGRGQSGCAITRRALDAWLLSEAVSAGVAVEEAAAVRAPLLAGVQGTHVAGVQVRGPGGGLRPHRARLTIAADGRRSALASALGLAAASRWPRRWAIGGYFEGVQGLDDCGEMHVRAGHYLGVAPLPGGLANACLVEPHVPGVRGWRDPARRLRDALAADAGLASRFAGARLVAPVVMLGPMAVDVPRPGVAGLLLAGDAAGFIDPLTGDGLRLAFSGAEMAAAVAIEVLDGRLTSDAAPRALAARRRSALAVKWAFNRTIRGLVAAPRGVAAATTMARLVPSLFVRLIRFAGDTGHASASHE